MPISCCCCLSLLAGLATLLFDLLSEEEAQNRHNVFDIGLLASRLQLAVEWMEAEGTHAAGKCPPDFPLGFFGASTGEVCRDWCVKACVDVAVLACVSRQHEGACMAALLTGSCLSLMQSCLHVVVPSMSTAFLQGCTWLSL